LFVAPFVLIFCAFMLYPLVQSIVLSFYKSAGPRELRFVGADNYKFLLTARVFWAAVFNTTYFATLFLGIHAPLSLLLAILVNRNRLRFRNVFRFAFFSPHLVGSVFVALIFQMLLAQRFGLINQVIGTVVPRLGTEINWFGKPE